MSAWGHSEATAPAMQENTVKMRLTTMLRFRPLARQFWGIFTEAEGLVQIPAKIESRIRGKVVLPLKLDNGKKILEYPRKPCLFRGKYILNPKNGHFLDKTEKITKISNKILNFLGYLRNNHDFIQFSFEERKRLAVFAA